MDWERLSRRDVVKSLVMGGAQVATMGSRSFGSDKNTGLRYAGGEQSSSLAVPAEMGRGSPGRGGKDPEKMIWGYLIHLSFNMWADREAPERGYDELSAKPYLRVDRDLWDELLLQMVEAGINMVVIDLGDGVKYETHPEIAVKDAWSVGELQQELARVRKLGLEPIPKLNFSATHDTWLGPYARCVSSQDYYRVCGDLISEVIQLFSRPRFFHLGMDEETAQHQRYHDYVLVRQYDLWWHDFNFLAEAVDKGGARPWIWSDYIWNHREVFLKRMPKSVLQSNWYYENLFNENVNEAKAYLDLEGHGYDQIPTGSNWIYPDNFARTVDYCREHIASERLFGFLQTVWKPTLREHRFRHLEAIDLLRQARALAGPS